MDGAPLEIWLICCVAVILIGPALYDLVMSLVSGSMETSIYSLVPIVIGVVLIYAIARAASPTETSESTPE